MLNKEFLILSHTISEETPRYAGEGSISLKQAKSIEKGDSCNTMSWSFSNHTGTHLDAPLHFIEKGLSVSDFKARDWFFNNVSLVEIQDTEPGRIIKKEDLEQVKDCELLLIRTGFEKYRQKNTYWQNSPALDPQIASHLKQNCPSLKAVGIDFISISNLNKRVLGREAHRAFLENNILLIEDMKLSYLEKAPDTVIVAPLLVEKADGAPCTVFGINNQ